MDTQKYKGFALAVSYFSTIISVFSMIISLPFFLAGGFVLFILGIILFICGHRIRKFYKSSDNKNTQKTFSVTSGHGGISKDDAEPNKPQNLNFIDEKTDAKNISVEKDELDLAEMAYNSVMSKHIDYQVDKAAQYTIVYRDSKDDVTRRGIDLQGFLVTEYFSIIAYCHLRNAQRQFIVDKIVHLYDSEGKEIENPKEYFLNIYHNSPKYKTEKLLESKSDQIDLLLFQAKVDGAMQKNERDLILQYLQSQLKEFDAKEAEKQLKSRRCEISQFNQILKTAKEWADAERENVLSVSKSLYELKKSPDEMETAVFQKIQKALSKN